MVNTLVMVLTLSDAAAPTIVAPQLRSLFLRRETDPQCRIDYPTLLRMIKSRMETDHCDLKCIALLTERAFGPVDPTLAELNMLCEEGLQVLLLDGLDASEAIDGWVFHRRY
ncbi:hypothetical protein C8R47DRAFT_1158385 [Mycena vitilis]|nr:hypothetical protein C8R47DRAFT_1158385 [Mycena vitilis]